MTEAKKWDRVYFAKGFFAKNPPSDSTIIYPEYQKVYMGYPFVVLSFGNEATTQKFLDTYKEFLAKNKMWKIERVQNVTFGFKFTNISNKEIPFSKLKEQLLKFYKKYFTKDVIGDMCIHVEDRVDGN